MVLKVAIFDVKSIYIINGNSYKKKAFIVNIINFYVKPKNAYLIQIYFRQKASSINQSVI